VNSPMDMGVGGVKITEMLEELLKRRPLLFLLPHNAVVADIGGGLR